jgi:hypothetical protein
VVEFFIVGERFVVMEFFIVGERFVVITIGSFKLLSAL